MAPHRTPNRGSSRIVTPSVDSTQTLPSRLPTRNAVPPGPPSITPAQPSRLLKKRPSSKKESGNSTMNTRSPPSGGVRRLTGQEIRRELESPVSPPQTRLRSPTVVNPKSPSSARAMISEPARTPSLVSGSSASTTDSPRSNRLRRKQSNIGKQNVRTSPDSSSSQEIDNSRQEFKDPYPDAVLGIAMPPVSSAYQPQEDIINLDYLLAHPTPLDLPPPPHYGLSSTPSTNYSPGPFSISSTPTSMTSASPSIASTAGSRGKQMSPIRSRPLTSRAYAEDHSSRSVTRGLAPVRESSSSSASTLRGGEASRSRSKPRITPMPATSESPLQQTNSNSHHRRISSGASSTAPSQSVNRKSQVLPEFAHLVDSHPHRSSNSISSPPARPSRDGTPAILVQEKSPVIQSNMASLPSALHKRQTSTDAKRSAGPLTIDTGKSRFGLARTRTVSPSPSQSSALSPRSAAPPTRGFTPDYPSESESLARIKPSPSTESKSFSRFGFFSKKQKPEMSTTAAVKDKKSKKGPAAGTGHEGYGRFAFRGRSGSTTSGSGATSAGRSPSTDSVVGANVPFSRKSSFGSKNGSNSDFEDFLAEREKPIAIRGGQAARPVAEKGDGEVTQPEDVVREVQFVSPSWNSSSTALEPPKRPTLLPSPMSDPTLPSTATKRDVTAKTVKEQKSVSVAGVSNVTSRRTSRRSFLGGKALVTAMESESSTEALSSIPPRKGSDAVRSPVQQDTQAQQSLKPPSKWNFLQRSKSPARKETPIPVVDPANVRLMPQRSIAHYAMGTPSINAEELEKIMQEAETSTPDDGSNSETERVRRSKLKGKAAARHGNSILLPAPPKFVPAYARPPRAASPKVTLKAEKSQEAPQPSTEAVPDSPAQITIVGQPRPSRLPQVGRIPRVVSKRDRERKLPDNSFSRPFAPSQPSPALKHSPQPPNHSTTDLSQANFNGLQDLAAVSATKGLGTPSDDLALSPHFSPPLGFMGFPGRKNSEQSTMSSCSGLFIASTTAIVPEPDAPWSDDEIWNEYDDVLDMLSNKVPKTPKTPMTGSSLGAPFQYAEFSPKDAAVVQRPSTAPSDSAADPPPAVPKIPTVASIAQQIRVPSMHDSRILSSLPSGTPNSPFRMSQFVAGYGERNLSIIDPLNGRLSLPSNGRLSTSSNGRFSLPATIRPLSSQTQTLPSTTHKPAKSSSSGRGSCIMERAETEYMGFENLANLRFGALMTSKWLSFGRVLFSPAHVELEARGENRVLIVDGLGKDWSFYVALNYPNASVYNLGTEPADAPADTATPISSLPNHRHIHHPNLEDPFPFPKGFFAAVVFRFPLATNETGFKSAIFECKRVLRPGGYLEISTLDMDMMNMGSRARSALRGLKMQMQSEDASVSLKPLSDTIQRLLYRRGFENLNRCFVAVPAAGRIPGSRDETSEPASSSAGDSSASSVKKIDEQLASFGDLIRAQGQDGDEGITKMVSRVGRWWYSRCYESLVLPAGDLTQSIWNDAALVRECEKRGTSLKLMICYAQKPDCPVRRTISV